MDRLLGLLIKLFIFLSGFGTYEKWEPGKKLKLLMVGYNGARNTGADARVAALCEGSTLKSTLTFLKRYITDRLEGAGN